MNALVNRCRSDVSRRFPMMIFLLAAAAAAGEATPPAPASDASPRWDARGPGLVPWQAISCLDVSQDGNRIALGAMALAGDPSVFLFDGDGTLLGQFVSGVRGPEKVVVTDRGRAVLAMCGTPRGTAGDRPVVWHFSTDGSAPRTIEVPARGDDWFFHYGENSNHLAVFLVSHGGQAAVVGDGQVIWNPSDDAGQNRPPRWSGPSSMTTAAAMGPDGLVAAGCVAPAPESPEESGRAGANLFVVQRGSGTPLWSRPAHADVDAARPMDEGRYGPPAPPWRDLRVYAPLAVAIDNRGQQIAVADYQGWERRFAARGVRREESYGIRFTPARPAISVYDRQGRLVRRWAPEAFAAPFWCELAFSADGAKLHATPRLWPCRGLAGRGVLPADPDARTRYVLDIAAGKVEHENAGPPVLSRALADGRRLTCELSRVRMLDAAGRLLWERDLRALLKRGDETALRNLKAREIAPGIWSSGGGSTHSDLGGQYVIQAPRGLILIDPNAGLSFAQYWARIRGAGLDPQQVRYVLITHEHGDHAPGAYLWRCITGAEVVASAEAAFTLRHHLPTGTGYGFHPPQPVDIVVEQDQELDLAGLKVRAVRLPGHTYGSMGWAFEKDGRRWIAIGDLIMPGGVLGYSGSINFSASDVLASLRKLQSLGPDAILPGHGPTGDPSPYLKGIEVGRATGWGRMTPEMPDPMYGFQRRDYLVVAWLENIQAAAFGDVDHDGRPDVAVLVAGSRGSTLKVYLNRGGRFGEKPDVVVELPELARGFKLQMCRLNDDSNADFLASSESAAVLLVSQPGGLEYRSQRIDAARATHIACGDFSGRGRMECVLGGRFTGTFHALARMPDGLFRTTRQHATAGPYFGMESIDANGDGRPDVLLSNGEVYLRRADGVLPDAPSVQLRRPGPGWTYMAAGDFTGDKRPDVVLLSQPPEDSRAVRIGVFRNTGDQDRPFAAEPDVSMELPMERGLVREGPTVGDCNGDGIADLIVAGGQGRQVVILPGTAGRGPDVDRKTMVTLDFPIHHDTRVGLGDFTGDGRLDLAVFGISTAGAAAVYIRSLP